MGFTLEGIAGDAKLADIVYARMEQQDVLARLAEFLKAFEAAKGAEIAKVYDEYITYTQLLDFCYALCYIRYTLNTADEFYAAEMQYWDSVSPTLSDKRLEISKIILAKKKLFGKALPAKIFADIEINLKTMSPEILEEMKKVNELTTEYSTLMSQLKVMWVDEAGLESEIPVTKLRKFFMDDNRDIRRKAYTAYGALLQTIAPKLDETFEQLAKLRDTQAKKLGLKNYVQLGYLRMHRNSYTEKDVAKFRAAVVKHLVPVVAKLYEKTGKELGIDKRFIYDTDIFLQQTPKPVGDEKQILAAAETMYNDLSSDTKELYEIFKKWDSFDVLSRVGKMPGGYFYGLAALNLPFIFANFNGSSADIDVLTHEFGHAMAFYLSGKAGNPHALRRNTMETQEVHSMAMEFLCYDYMDRFFGAEADRYKFYHLASAIGFIPYGVAVDEFQHILYEKPNLTPSERNAEWLKLEAKYRPHLSNEGVPHFESGGRWQYQAHIYSSPFYYIDYTLAQIIALQFDMLQEKDSKKAWQTYVEFCSKGGTKTYLELVKEAGMKSPFCEKTIKMVADHVAKKLMLNV